MDIIFSQRLRAFLDYLRSKEKIYNDADFCKKTHKRAPLLSDLLHGKRNITPGFAESIAPFFPELNPRWLYDINCTSMLNDTEVVDGSQPAYQKPIDASSVPSGELERLHKIIEQQQATIDRLLRIIERMQNEQE